MENSCGPAGPIVIRPLNETISWYPNFRLRESDIESTHEVGDRIIGLTAIIGEEFAKESSYHNIFFLCSTT